MVARWDMRVSFWLSPRGSRLASDSGEMDLKARTGWPRVHLQTAFELAYQSYDKRQAQL